MEEEEKKKEKKKDNKWNIILKILIFVILVLIILELSTSLISKGFRTLKHSFFRATGIESKEGNTIGNINNYGYIAEDNKYLYYMCPTKNGKYIGISKVSKDNLTGPQIRLIEGSWEIASINSYGDYIYFTTLNQNEVDENDENADEVDNKIHRVNKNGDQKDEILNDNEFNNYSYKTVIVDGKIYYIGEDECIWYMDLDGKNKTKLNDNASGFEAINDKYILYNMPKFEDGEETSVSYIMDRNGKNAREINGKRIYTPIIYKDSIYYLTKDRYPHRMNLDGKHDIMLSDKKAYSLNVSDDGVFFLNYELDSSEETDEQSKSNEENDEQVEANEETEEEAKRIWSVYRMDLDGKNNKKLYTLQRESNSLCLVKDWAFFIDSNETSGYMEIISKDGKQKIDLFQLNYEDYYYLDEVLEGKEISENTVNESVENTTPTNET